MTYITIREEDSKIHVIANVDSVDMLIILKKLIGHIDGTAFNYKQVMLDCINDDEEE